jgi:hypothetical protein
MSDERLTPGARGGPNWPMAPGVPGSARAREARTMVGLSPDASDSEFVGASPDEGRDALVAAARRRLEPVIAAHGLNSRESWLVDHELKSALGRLLASAPQRSLPVQRPAPAAVPAPTHGRQSAGADIAKALYVRRHPLGRALLGIGMGAQVTVHPPGAATPHGTRSRTAPALGMHEDDADAWHAHVPVQRRSRARIIAATVAVLSAIGLVIEVAYVPVHLQRSRARQQAVMDAPASTGASAPPQSPSAVSRAAPTPATQPDAAGSPQSGRGTQVAADRAAGASPEPSPANSAPPTPRQVPIPSPALPADPLADSQQRPASAATERIDPTLRQRLDELAAQWSARMVTSIEAQRTTDAMEPGPARWLAQARLLERLLALDDIAQLLIDARADEAGPLIDVMPVPCGITSALPSQEGETSMREDGRLVADLSRAGGGGESRLAVLRAYRSLPVAPGRADARALVSEALGGPSRNSRALALAILLERGPASVAVLEAVHARATDLAATPAGRAVVEQLAGEPPGGPPLDAQSLRAQLARRILEGRGSPMHLIDATADAISAMLDRMARRADPQVAPADMESSLATLARAASRDAAPARADGASGPLQRMVASLAALDAARIVRNYRRLPDERMRVDAAAAEASARALAADSSLAQAIEVAIGILAQDCIALRAQEMPAPQGAASAGGERTLSNPLLWPEPREDAFVRWPEAARALEAADGEGQALDADVLLRLAEDVQDASQDADDRSIAARLYARAATVGNEAAAASAARGIASLIPPGSAPLAAERQRWEAVAAQYAMADAAMRGRSRLQRRPGAVGDAEADASSRAALADALALCVSGSGRQAIDRLQSPTVRALAQRLSGALPGGIAGLEALCEGRTPSSPPLDSEVADQLLAVEAALRDVRSMRWSDDLALRRGLPLVSVDTASRAARQRLFTPAPAPDPR